MANESNVFGICLGHQLISLATGHEIKKMKYGNRGHNIPVCLRDTDTKNLGFVTSQNHGYMTIEEEKDLNDPQNNYSYFKNINDNSNEGLVGENIFSVQFHPEARAGPDDTTFLFDIFLKRRFNYISKKYEDITSYKDLVKTAITQRSKLISKTPYTISSKT